MRVLYLTTTFRSSEQQQNTNQVLKWINLLINVIASTLKTNNQSPLSKKN